ncbi:MAG: N-acyl homoserine lactonase family protein [Pseudomonadota bacterium]
MVFRNAGASSVVVLLSALAACDGEATDPPAPVEPAASETAAISTNDAAAEQLELHKLPCGTIEISDLDLFSTAGDYAGVPDTFTNTCWLVRHPNGDLLWDLGLPGMLTAAGPQDQGIFTVSLSTTLREVLAARGIPMETIEQVSISHSHFDHIGQVDQIAPTTKWLVHQDEYAFMFPSDGENPPDNAAQFAPFGDLEAVTFSGKRDVFGDGSVLIHETPGHTPGHTSLQVNLPDTGPVFLTGDLYHRAESRVLRRVPQFNWDVENADAPGAITTASMDAFEAIVASVNGQVIIQHEPVDVDAFPDVSY